MCFSAQIHSAYRRFAREVGAELSVRDFVEIYVRRREDPKVKIPKGVDALFAQPASAEERQINALIDEHNAQQAATLQQELFKQRKRLADAERALQIRATKTATDSKRIAGNKVEWLLGKLGDLQRTEPRDEDHRVFPGSYVPVIVQQGSCRLVRPMRYQCRPAGKPAFYDSKFPGTYNARRDSLGGFWKDLFGFSHAIMVATSFYENVERTLGDGKKDNVVLQFKPRPEQPMLVACLWSHWSAPDAQELLSFAAITDEPPPEVAAAGHDRCIVPIRPEHVDGWLNPRNGDLAELHRILDDRARPYYEHRLAA